MVSFKICFYTFDFCLKEFFLCVLIQSISDVAQWGHYKENNGYSAQLLSYLHNQVDNEDSY